MGYDEQLSAAKFRAERDQARQELARLRGEATTMSAYDLLPEEDREALRWVRGHGGLDEVIRDFKDAYNRRFDLYAALGIDLDTGWSDAMAELDRRLMPEGMKWPMYESGEPVRIGDVVSDVEVRSIVFRDDGILFSDCTSVPGWGTWRSYKEPIKRPAPKVLDADRAEIHEWDAMKVLDLSVLAADVRPLEAGQTVWDTNGDEYVVERIYSGTTEPDFPGHTVACRRPDDIVTHMFEPSQLTHERPDSWERIEEDAGCTATKYNERRGTIFTTKQQVARDLVRRARALAERERGE